VDLQLIIPGESHTADLTGKGLLACMGPHVAGQFASPVDYLVADWALLGHLGAAFTHQLVLAIQAWCQGILMQGT
jgi:hypothetical protein